MKGKSGLIVLLILSASQLTQAVQYRLIPDNFLDTGNRWDYNLTFTVGGDSYGGTAYIQVIGTENVAGYTAQKIEFMKTVNSLGWEKETMFWYMSASNVIEVSSWFESSYGWWEIETVANNNPAEVLPVYINDSDNHTFLGSGEYSGTDIYDSYTGSSNHYITYLGHVNVTVPAGAYDCIYIRSETTYTRGWKSHYIWFSPSIGIVKMQGTEYEEGITIDFDMELTSGPPSEPINPSPNNGDSNQSITADLSWSNGGGATSYNVYFGTDSSPDSEEYQGNQSGTSYNPGTLAYGTTYYWRIDAVNSDGTATGDLWSFTTEVAPLEVPDVVGLSQSTAESTITSAGLVVGTETFAHSSTVPAGRIISQDPAAGISIALGSSVNLVISTGPPPPSKPVNPNPSNGAANRSITVDLTWSNGGGAASYNVYFGTDNPPTNIENGANQTNTSYDPGTLLYNTPYFWRINAVNSGGTTTGDLWSFTTDVAPPEVPDVVGLPQSTAESTITSAGLVVGTETSAYSRTVPTGRIIEQDPVAGASVALGSAVNLVISAGSPPPSKPVNPGPSNGAANQPITIGLSWSDGGNAASYNVYFGTDNPPTNIENGANQTNTSYDPGTLVRSATYYWRIDAVNSNGTATGNLWSFTTEGVLVPNVVGLSQSTAESTITSIGLVVGTETSTYSHTVPTGETISQDPPAGISVTLGSSVNLVISTGPTIYVDGVTGSDTQGNGAPTNPYKTVQKANEIAADGDKIVILAGRYPENITFDKQLRIEARGGLVRIGYVPCIVGFDDFARFAEYWLQKGSGLPADIDLDGDVDSGDLSRFADSWLDYCPESWTFK